MEDLLGASFLGAHFEGDDGRWACITRETYASSVGMWRVSEFDKHGPWGHMTRKTPRECLNELRYSGYRLVKAYFTGMEIV